MAPRFSISTTLRATFVTLCLGGVSPAADYDVIIRGGTVYDGSGSKPRLADVGVRGDRIASIGDLSKATATRVLDAKGLAVAPGFINMLSWSVDSLIVDVRDEKLIPLEEAIRRLTALPAANLGLDGRGGLKVGMFADVVAFDPLTIGDRATFENPHQYSVGMKHVLVNGSPVLVDGEHTGSKPGRALYGPGREVLKVTLHLAGDSTMAPDGIADNTHFSPKGAALMADLVAEAIRAAGLPLARELK